MNADKQRTQTLIESPWYCGPGFPCGCSPRHAWSARYPGDRKENTNLICARTRRVRPLKDLGDPDGRRQDCFPWTLISRCCRNEKCSKSTGSDPVESPGNVPGERVKILWKLFMFSWSEVLEKFFECVK